MTNLNIPQGTSREMMGRLRRILSERPPREIPASERERVEEQIRQYEIDRLSGDHTEFAQSASGELRAPREHPLAGLRRDLCLDHYMDSPEGARLEDGFDLMDPYKELQ